MMPRRNDIFPGSHSARRSRPAKNSSHVASIRIGAPHIKTDFATTRATLALTASTRPTSSFALTAIRRRSDGPTSRKSKLEVAAWYEATTLAEEKAIARRLNKAALDNAIYAPLGHHVGHHAWRKNVAGIVPGPAFFWG